MVKRVVLMVLLFLSMASAQQVLCEEYVPQTLAEARHKVQGEIDRLDAGLLLAAERLGKSGLTGTEARAALAELCGGFSWALDCAAIDAKGTMVTIAPPSYGHFEGTSIADQEQVIRMLRDRKPVMSSMFMTVEGVSAVDVERPVLTPKGEFLGSVSLIFKPEQMLASVIQPVTRGVPMEVWVMEPGGKILYDADTRQIGLELFTAPLYQPFPTLLTLGRRIAAEPTGSGEYQFLDRTGTQTKSKRTYWQTAALYDTSWRVVGIHPVAEQSAAAADPALRQQTVHRLKSFARTTSLTAALSQGNKAALLKLFKKFHADNPGIYSIQWLAVPGITRFGYPAENSLYGYDFRARRTPEDQKVLKVLGAKKAATLELAVFEGNRGVFIYQPVFKGKRYLGMVYLILLK